MTPFDMSVETPIEKHRSDSFFTKEPETLAWIESFSADDVFIDIGANIGIYSLYAASLFSKMPILAIEPMEANFKRLEENKKLNGFSHLFCFPMAVSDRNRMCRLSVPDGTVGASGTQIQDGSENIALSLETIMTGIDRSVNIKIDIDGQELSVIKGIGLAWSKIKSVLVEINNNKNVIFDIFTDKGFTTQNRFNAMTPHSRERRQKEGIQAENIIFTRG